MARAEAEGGLEVEVVYGAGPRSVWSWRGELPPGSRVEDALRASGLLEAHPRLAGRTLVVGIWGRKCGADARLVPRDRVEVYRPLEVDPKEARRRRWQRQRESAVRTCSPKR